MFLTIYLKLAYSVRTHFASTKEGFVFNIRKYTKVAGDQYGTLMGKNWDRGKLEKGIYPYTHYRLHFVAVRRKVRTQAIQAEIA